MPVPLFFESGRAQRARSPACWTFAAGRSFNFRADEVRGAASLKRGVDSFQCFALTVRSFELHFPPRNGLFLYTVRFGK